ncbi:HAD-IA family hydrolase [Aurantimonas marianensis]|uniref:phosphoglycolate phosphatase n=1 Tax=Aurantimonas marianensis TaxID=2920428 RepID=A0A9X2KF04_9HYPH|nr:HAD-IA family hydrolase [Aurantimonas marianensis]MCP3055239.1 HAD-IA family hydrolase [Aurantimonas marianensis]
MARVAVFDLDGTLVDTAPDHAASLNHCLAAARMPTMSLDMVRPYAGHGARVMLDEAYRRDDRPLPDQELNEQTARFLAHYEANIAVASAPFPGAVAAMDRLVEAGFRLAVCTNKYERFARLLLSEIGLADRFAAICGSDTFARRKPDPSHLTGTIERAGGRSDASIMIGDTSTDIDAAVAAGIPSILVDFGYAPDANARARASFILDDYAHLDAALAGRLIGAPARLS